jgi:hypothetical protein
VGQTQGVIYVSGETQEEARAYPRDVPPFMGMIVPSEPGLEMRGMSHQVQTIDPVTGQPVTQTVQDPHVPFLFTQSPVLQAMQRTPLSRNLVFTLEVPVPAHIYSQWRAWGVRNLVYKSHEAPGQPPTLVFHGLGVSVLRQGRSNKNRPHTYYLFFEFYAETSIEPEPGKITAYAYRARILTSDLALVAQGIRPRAVRGTIELDPPIETHWPVLSLLRQL